MLTKIACTKPLLIQFMFLWYTYRVAGAPGVVRGLHIDWLSAVFLAYERLELIHNIYHYMYPCLPDRDALRFVHFLHRRTKSRITYSCISLDFCRNIDHVHQEHRGRRCFS